jgi:DNA-binding CsgD family transcriptional regulator
MSDKKAGGWYHCKGSGGLFARLAKAVAFVSLFGEASLANRKQVVEIIGENAMKRLIAWRPGGRFRVPRDPKIIFAVVGARAAKALCQALPHEVIYIPRRNDQIGDGRLKALIARGKRPREIAQKLCRSVRTAYRLTEGTRPKSGVDRAEITRLLALGERPSAIARKLSCSRQTVYRVRNEAGLCSRV